jgi:hypothetical protein
MSKPDPCLDGDVHHSLRSWSFRGVSSREPHCWIPHLVGGFLSQVLPQIARAVLHKPQQPRLKLHEHGPSLEAVAAPQRHPFTLCAQRSPQPSRLAAPPLRDAPSHGTPVPAEPVRGLVFSSNRSGKTNFLSRLLKRPGWNTEVLDAACATGGLAQPVTCHARGWLRASLRFRTVEPLPVELFPPGSLAEGDYLLRGVRGGDYSLANLSKQLG